jgi:hypothetical protein
VQCRALADCANGYLTCTNNTCACRQKRSANILRNPGLDGSASMWTTSGPYDGNDDADNCPASGSIHLSTFGHSLSQCVAATAGTTYQFGFRFKGDGTGGAGTSQCDFAFYNNSSCSTYVGGGTDIILVNSNGTWVSGVQTQTAPTGTGGISVHCATAAGTGYYDQFYLTVGGGGF